MASGGRRHGSRDPDEKLSRLLAKVLRHEAKSLGLPIHSDGFIFVSDLLSCSKFHGYGEADIRRVVGAYTNQRFTLENDRATGRLKIKAKQAHSIDVPDLDLEEITSAREIPVLIHLTTKEAYQNIKLEGLKPMSRQHIHFSPGEEHIYRSKSQHCKIKIYLDTQKAMAGGVRFYRSENNVVLSPGNQNGIIPPQFFKEVVEILQGGRN